jgi:hypothetical protein
MKSPIKNEVFEEKPVFKAEKPATPVPEPEPEPEPVKEEEPEPVKEEPKYEARWVELEEKILKRIFAFCVVNDGAVPFLVRASRVCSSWHKASQVSILLNLFSFITYAEVNKPFQPSLRLAGKIVECPLP